VDTLRIFLMAALILVVIGTGDVDAGKEPEWSYDDEGGVYSVAISADGEYIAAGSAGSDDDRVYLFDKDSNTPLWSYTSESGITTVDISVDGEYITAGGYDKKVYLFNKDSSTPLWNYTTGGYVRSVAISADGEYIAAGSQDGKVYLFDKDSNTPLWSYTSGGLVRSVAISANGEYIAAGSSGSDDKVYLFDRDSSTPLWSYTAGDSVRSVAISADGEYIAAGSADSKVYLFGKDSSTPIWSYTTEGTVVNSVAISADGEYIVAGSADSKVYLFGKDSSTPNWSYATGGSVSSIAISADGEYIVAGSWDHNVYLFDNAVVPITTDWTKNDVLISINSNYQADNGIDLFIKFLERTIDSQYVDSNIEIVIDNYEDISTLEVVIETEETFSPHQEYTKELLFRSSDGNEGTYSLDFDAVSFQGALNLADASGLPIGTMMSMFLETQPDLYITQVIITDDSGDKTVLRYNTKFKTSKDFFDDVFTLPHQEIIVASPVNIEVFDSNGNLINYNDNVFYSGPDYHPEFVIIIEPRETDYTIRVTGNDDGDYTLISRSIENGKIISEEIEENIAISESEIQEKTVMLIIPDAGSQDYGNGGSVDITSISLIPVLISIGLIAIYRRK